MICSLEQEQHRAMMLLPQNTAEVDLGAVKRNIKALKRLTAPGTQFMAVIKANAYGHGAVPVAGAAMAAGANFLAVARISEAAELREAGIKLPVLLFGDVLPDQAVYMATHNIRASITNLDMAKALAAQLTSRDLTLKVHIKVDTGMGRLGFVHNALNEPGSPQQGSQARLVQDILAIESLAQMKVEGIYTHLSRSDEKDKAHARLQIKRFRRLTDQLAAREFIPEFRHLANSAGVIDMPDSHFDMVRPGISIYGLWPSDQVDKTRITLEPAMSIRSKIIQTKTVPKGFEVSYGATHVTAAPTVIATVPIGYADGYSRLLSNRGHMLVRGKRAPILGRVCMDFTMIDVGHIPGVVPGDEVVIMGTQGSETICADDIARLTHTINYEVTAGLTGRIPLHYITSGEHHAGTQ